MLASFIIKVYSQSKGVHRYDAFGPFHTWNFTCAESDTDEQEQYIFFLFT